MHDLVTCTDSHAPSNEADRCPHCGGEILPTWLGLRETLRYLRISNSQRVRLQRQGFLPQPSETLGARNLRWRRAELDAALIAGRHIAGVFSQQAMMQAETPEGFQVEQAITEVLHRFGQRRKDEPDIQTPWR